MEQNKELNAEQIIKALEWCALGFACMNCKYDKGKQFSKEGCMALHMRDALSLIKQLTEENVELTRTCTALTRKVQVLDEQYNSLLDRNMELAEEIQKWQEAYDYADAACRELNSKCDELTEENERLRADTVREMRGIIQGIIEFDIALTEDETTYLLKRLDETAQEMLEGK